MIDSIIAFLLQICGNNPYLFTFLAAMVPVIEVRGAIPLGVSLNLDIYSSAVISYFGAFIITILLLLILPILFKLLKKFKWFNSFYLIIKDKIEKISKSNFNIYVALLIFVSVPVPLTGVFTGCVMACFLNLNFYKSLLYVSIGNLIATIIMSLITVAFKEYSIYITLFFTFMLFVIASIYVFKIFLKRRKIN